VESRQNWNTGLAASHRSGGLGRLSSRPETWRLDVQAAGEARGGNEAVFAGLLDEFLQEGLRSRAYDAEWIRYPQAPSTSCMVRPILGACLRVRSGPGVNNCRTKSRFLWSSVDAHSLHDAFASREVFLHRDSKAVRESGVKDHDPHENRDAESTAGRR
jgi:hypothetical protein